MQTRADIAIGIRRILVEQLGVKAEEVRDDASMADDLGQILWRSLT